VPTELAERLLAWFDIHGRHDLPWQRDSSPYMVWVSEIMLQQTQVATVIPYYERFIAAFPDVAALADAKLDDVLALWSGLGYYARARNLHKAARIVCDEHAGRMPDEIDPLMELPGIGRSTAGAILSLSLGQRHPILDGNAKRVLARVHGIEGWPGETQVLRELWRLAELETPGERVAAYTQAIMDLGATLCTRGKPQCRRCPMADLCVAHAQGLETKVPAPRPKQRDRQQRAVTMLLVRDRDGAVLVERRPATGIWGGLYSLPEIGVDASPDEWCRANLGAQARSIEPLEILAHSFTHFDLEIRPMLVDLDSSPSRIMDRGDRLWYNAAQPAALGMPAPVTTLIDNVTSLGRD